MMDPTERYLLAKNFPYSGKYSLLWDYAFFNPYMAMFTGYQPKYPQMGVCKTDVGNEEPTNGIYIGDTRSNNVYYTITLYRSDLLSNWNMAEGTNNPIPCVDHMGRCTNSPEQSVLVGKLYHSFELRDKWASKYGYSDPYRDHRASIQWVLYNKVNYPPLICAFGAESSLADTTWYTCSSSTKHY